LNAVSNRERPLLVPIYGHPLLTTWIVGSLRTVFPLDCQPVIGSIDALHARVLAFADPGFLRAAAVTKNIPDVVPFGPGAVRSGEILTRHKDLDSILMACAQTLRLQLRMDGLVDLRARAVV